MAEDSSTDSDEEENSAQEVDEDSQGQIVAQNKKAGKD